MHLRTKLTVLAAVAVTALGGAGAAYACDGTHHDTNGVAGATFTLEHHHGYGLLAASAKYLGLTTEQLKAKLKTGATLGQVADATPGKSSAGLVDYLTGLVKTRLDKLVAANRITSAQETTILSGIQAKLTKLVAVKWTAHERMDWHH
jgi:hypothetical protein